LNHLFGITVTNIVVSIYFVKPASINMQRYSRPYMNSAERTVVRAEL